MDPCRLTAPPRRNFEPRTRGAGAFSGGDIQTASQSFLEGVTLTGCSSH